MRSKSRKTDGYVIYAISGTNSISFAIDAENADTKGLLGFAVERWDKIENERYFMRGFKVFQDMIANPDENTTVSTYEHPVQSFVWDDFTGKPDYEYQYFFYPLRGTPRHIDRSSRAITVQIRTEPLYNKKDKHDIFFNRGVASSQAYYRRFHNATPGSVSDPTKLQGIYKWLARDLQSAIMDFIDQAEKGDTLLACFYEFRHKAIAEKFKQAIDRGVNVTIIVDAKNNSVDFPRQDNIDMIKSVKIPMKNIILRESNKNNIQHNKFIVYMKGESKTPTSVWTGSTNLSDGGIYGQANVGHWVRDKKTADSFRKYWEILKDDPGSEEGNDRSKNIELNKSYKQSVVRLQKDIEYDNVSDGITPIFSPRTSVAMLDTYVKLLDSAKNCAAVTLAFGISDKFKEILCDNSAKDHITFMLLEKKDQPKLDLRKIRNTKRIGWIPPQLLLVFSEWSGFNFV